MRRPGEIDERRVDAALEKMWHRLTAPPEDDLHAIAAEASTEARRPAPAERDARQRWARLGRGGALGLAGAALLIGSGLGFGLGSSLTPSGSAGGNFVGFGFLPAQGWNVMQSGTLDVNGVARAIAANVPLDPRDDLGGPPASTLDSLPPRGVLLYATFGARGDPETDFRFPVRELPLQMAQATRASSITRGAQYRLLAAVGGHNVDVRIYFGAEEPSASAVATAQRQLNRLVVASERVTIFVRPSTVQGRQPVTVFGSVDSGNAGEDVTIQAKDCGQDFFRAAAGAVTRQGGGWSTEFTPWITTTVRAVWNDVASTQLTVRQRAEVTLNRTRSAGRFTVWVVAKKQFWRKRVLIQRFDRRVGTWRTVRSVVLTETGANDPTGRTATVWSRATFRLPLSRGTLVRAVFPLSQARPCYLAGVSDTLRV